MHPGFNYEPLTPTAFLHRAAQIFPDRLGVVEGDVKFTYGEFLQRSLKFAGALKAMGVKPGDRVAILAGNTHVMLAAHYAVPFAGAVLVALNTRVTAADMAYILGHSGSSVLIYDQEFAKAATEAAKEAGAGVRLVRVGGDADQLETLIAAARPFLHPVTDERAMLAINYTSGTTARPKGVMYHHRGAYLQALAMALHMGINSDSVYLWTLPMFHCNGWCFPWGVTAMGGVHLCLPKVEASAIWRHMRESGVSHFCAAPTVLTMTIWDPGAGKGETAARGPHRHRGARRPRRRCWSASPSSAWTSPTSTGSPRPTVRRSSANGAASGTRCRFPSGRGSSRARVSTMSSGSRSVSSMTPARTFPVTRRPWARSRSAATTSCSVTTRTRRRLPGAARMDGSGPATSA